MSWFDILKLISPRQFLEHFSEKLGGEVSGRALKDSDDFKLTHDAGYIKVVRKGVGKYIVNVNGEHFFNDFNLESMKSNVEGVLANIEKKAGTVTTESAPELFNHGKSMRDLDGEEDKEE